MRTFGHATCVAFSKIGAFISPFIVISNISYVGVGIILGILNILASLAVTRLPETTGSYNYYERMNEIYIDLNVFFCFGKLGEDLGRFHSNKFESSERLLKENAIHSPVHSRT